LPQLRAYIFKAPLRTTRIVQRRTKFRLRRDLIKVKGALAQEREETREMLAIYVRYTQRNASKEEMKQANAQFVDVLRGLGLGVFAVLPFSPITIPIAVKLGKRLGVDVLPSSFRD